MKSRPILFNAPMVRALLVGTKTQTRRISKEFAGKLLRRFPNQHGGPYGEPGDQLWVRETHYAWGRWETRYSAKKGRDEWHFIDMTLECGKAYVYPASDRLPQPLGGKRQIVSIAPAWWKRPAIHMSRAAGRIDLEIIGVRVERLHDISEADAQAEGITTDPACPAYDAYAALWGEINGPGSWDLNPWVWVIEFRRLP